MYVDEYQFDTTFFFQEGIAPESTPETPTDQGSSAELRICIPPPKPVSAPPNPSS